MLISVPILSSHAEESVLAAADAAADAEAAKPTPEMVSHSVMTFHK